MTASTANSGRVWSQARIASASPWAMKNCAASAPHMMRTAEERIAPKVQLEAMTLALVAPAAAVPATSPRRKRPERDGFNSPPGTGAHDSSPRLERAADYSNKASRPTLLTAAPERRTIERRFNL